MLTTNMPKHKCHEKFKDKNTKISTPKQIDQDKYTKTNAQRQIHQDKHSKTNTTRQINQAKYTKTNTSSQIHQDKYTRTYIPKDYVTFTSCLSCKGGRSRILSTRVKSILINN